MDTRLVLKILSGLAVVLGVILFIPALHAYSNGYPFAYEFFYSGLCGILPGAVGWYHFHSYRADVSHRTGFAVVGFSWFLAGSLGALPYYFSHSLPGIVDSVFESFSGFSGTGASVITNIEATNPSILLWRSMTQWLGGMGIIVFFIAILPILGVGGVQLFRAETTGPSKEKITPKVRDTARILWGLYVGLTVVLTAVLCLLGMSLYDAANHAMTTMSTGGFSTKNVGVASFENPAIDYAIGLFMVIGSISFALYYRLITRPEMSIFKDTEMKAYLSLLTVMTGISTLMIWGTNYETLEESFRSAFFTVAATASSTGFTNDNYLLWPEFTHYLLVLLMVMGGSSGSTAGGMKCIRLVAAFKLLQKELKQVIHPHAVISVSMNDKAIRDNVASAIWGFLFLYLFVFSLITAVLSFDGIDRVSAGTATISALSNIGPALGSFGPMDNYAALSDLSKLTLSIGMIMGRLEFITVIILFTPYYWKH